MPKEDPQYSSFLGVLKTINRGAEERETQIKALTLGMSYVNLFGYPLDLQVLSIIPEELSREGQAIPFFRKDNILKVGLVNPQHLASRQKIEKAAHQKDLKVNWSLISLSSFLYGLELYKKVSVDETISEDIEVEMEDISDFENKIHNLSDLKKDLEKMATTDIVKVIFAGAIFSKASDVHIEPGDKKVNIRYRIDGVLHDVLHLKPETYKIVLSRIKFLAKMKINITNVPQDGKFSIRSLNRRFDIRVSGLPTPYGESLVMRLLDQQQRVLSLEEMGLMGKALDDVEKAITKTNGMILSTGPTGSGKTTTLYALLGRLNTEDRKIITIEDPIEYKLPGVSQSQVDPDTEYTFANGLRSIVRQDPDIIMVGEIRDHETADITINAALTGHLVFSTLHTNDAVGAIPRLADMGIASFLLASGLSVVVAQRLVRRICEECAVEREITPDEIEKIQKIVNGLPAEIKNKIDLAKFHNLREGGGCSVCNNTGYKGRIGLFEVLLIGNEMKKIIHDGASDRGIKELALKEGMITMEEDGILKVLDGMTTLKEVGRVVS